MGSTSSLKNGFVGGFFATAVMTLFRAPTARSLPPTAEFVAKFIDSDPDEFHVTSLVLHGLYGTLSGILFSLVVGQRISESSEPESVGLLSGGVYGISLSVFGEQVVLQYGLGMNLDTDESAIFHVGHLIYGLALGAWVGSRHE